MHRPRFLIALLFGAVLTAPPAAAQSRHRHENKALLGVVTEPAGKGARIVHVLAKSPAARAGLAAGDVIVRIGDRKRGKKPLTPRGVDEALRDTKPDDAVEVLIRRKKKPKPVQVELQVKLIARSAYKGDFLKPRARGATGFKAPEWFAYAWANVKKGKEPTRAATKGKVVVIHAFQSW